MSLRNHPMPWERPGQEFVVPFARCSDCRVSHGGCTIRWIAAGEVCCDTCHHVHDKAPRPGAHLNHHSN